MKRQEIAVICLTVAMLLGVDAVFVAIFGVYSNGYTVKYSPIYLSSGSMKFFHDSDGFVLGNAQFKVHNAWTSNSKYTVQVLPTGEDFYFQVDGRWYSYLDTIKDLTPGFNIVIAGSKFTIFAKCLTMQQVLSELNDGKDIVIASNGVNSTAHYKLVVSTLDGRNAVSITFRCQIPTGVDDVELPPNLVI